MWIARDKHGHMLLFIKHKPFRDNNDGMWIASEPEIYLDHELFPLLTWDDEPIEVRLVENNPLHKRICPHCGKTISYYNSDVKIAYDGQPSSTLSDFGEDYIICPKCEKMIYL